MRAAPSPCARACRSSTSTPRPASSATSWPSPTPSAAPSPRRALLQDLHPPAAAVAAVREGPAPRGRPGPAARQARTSASGAPSTAAATPTCSSSAAGCGLAAAIAAARAGADVVLADEGPEPGGRALAEGGHERARELAEQARAAGVEILTSPPRWASSTASPPSGRPDPAPGPLPPPRLRHRRRRAAARLREQRPARGHALRRRAPADRALRHRAGHARGGGHDVGSRPRGRPTRCAPPAWRSSPSPTCAKAEPCSRPRVRRHVRAAVLGGPSTAARACAVECSSLIVTSGGAAPVMSLVARPPGCDPVMMRVRGHVRDRRAARRCARRRRGRRPTATTPSARGARAGALTAHALGLGEAPAEDPDEPHRRPARPRPCPPPWRAPGRGKCFACLCEDVTAKDIHLSVDEGYDSIELSKRYTTATMGPCQGRMCQLARHPPHGAGDRPGPRRASAPRPRARRGRPSRWAPWRGARSTRPSARPSTPATASSAPASWAGRLAARLRLRRPAGRVAAVPGRRADRPLDPRQADRPRPRGGGVPRPAAPEPLRDLSPGAAYGVLTSDAGTSWTTGRRPARRGALLRHHDDERRRRGGPVVLAGGWPMAEEVA